MNAAARHWLVWVGVVLLVLGCTGGAEFVELRPIATPAASSAAAGAPSLDPVDPELGDRGSAPASERR